MNLHVIATGSSGNCYVLEGNDSVLIIEAGVAPEKVFQRVRVSTRKIAGVLITHEHGDHAGFIRRWLELGFRAFMSPGTRAALRLEDSVLVEPLRTWQLYDVGPFKVRPFPAVHDAAEPFSYIIEHPESGRILFATDIGKMNFSFASATIRHLVIEANYADPIVDENVYRGRMVPALAKRVRENHLSLDRCRAIVKEHNTPDLETVVLIHLSGDNADPAIFREEIRKTAPYANVYVADKGLIVRLDKLAI
ncbi:MAG: MBL fold metallo-hydrolase [Oscillibacter sp.]|nr:MBL fold metallo-hydrolase [Oscillibacter sp.]